MVDDPTAENSILVVAHRALAEGVPENSVAGIRSARDVGANLVELDVRRSLDGVPYLLHDRTLTRTTTGRGLIRLLPSRYLSAVRLKNGNEPLPTLAAALQALPDGVSPALHLKDQGSLRAAVREIQRAGMEAITWLWLHGTASVRLAQQLAPSARVTLLEAGAKTLSEWECHLDAARTAGATGVSIPWDDLSPALLKEINSRGLRSFSLNHDTGEILEMVQHGLLGIITDDPAATCRVIENHAKSPGAGGEIG
jgi:glycerophosphoryl diester phosphodiesterase